MKQKNCCFSKIFIIVFLLVSISFGFNSFDSREIANTALGRVGEVGLSCKAFVQSVVTNLGEPLGTGYKDCYLELGREIFNEDDVAKGDIIQISNDIDPKLVKSPPIHSAIVVENLGNGNYKVVHSNWPDGNKVRIKLSWNPVNYASSESGWSAHFYRLGNVGYHENGNKTQAFIDVFNILKLRIGWPNGGDGTDYVHEWKGKIDNTFSIICQDYKQDDLAQSHYGTDGKSMLILNDLESPKKAYHLKEGFLGYYRENNGPETIGMPFTEEVSMKYANNPDGDNIFLKTGQNVTVQKFKRRKNGLYYNNERKTLVYDPVKKEVKHYPIGSFRMGGTRVCQWFIMDNENPGDPSKDRPWPMAGVKAPLTKHWFTKAGIYNFVLHEDDDLNKSRIQGLGFTVPITEGNSQSGEPDAGISSPNNLRAVAYNETQINLSWDNVVGAERYFIYRNTINNSGSSQQLSWVGNNSFADANCNSGITYYYWVKAYRDNKYSSYSNMASAKTDVSSQARYVYVGSFY